jgi:hypothetical protein
MQGVLSRRDEAFWLDLGGDHGHLHLAQRWVNVGDVDDGCLSGTEWATVICFWTLTSTSL